MEPGPGFFSHSVGVTTFFVISGFLITRLLLRERQRSGTILVVRFWLRRALRIFPLYYAVLAAYILLIPLTEKSSSAETRFWASLPYYASFTTNWFVSWLMGERVIFYFAWSLAVQEQFYLVWPLVLRLARGRGAVLLPLAFLLTEEVGGLAVDAGWLPRGTTYRVLTTFDSPIFLGVLAAFLLESQQAFRMAERIAGRSWSIPAAVGAILLVGSGPNVSPDLLRLGITYLVLACVLAPPLLVRLVDNPVFRHVGSVSYGIYLLHMLALNAVRRLLPGQRPAMVFALGFPLVVLAATASHNWFERYFMQLRDAYLGPHPTALALSPPKA